MLKIEFTAVEIKFNGLELKACEINLLAGVKAY
jgi:hypothetical protein